MYRSLVKIRDLIQATFGNTFKSFYIDNPNLIPLSEMPCVAIEPINTDINIADTARDEWVYTIDIHLIIDAKQELLKYKQEMVGTQYLTEIMEAKNSTTGALMPNTILYVLRNNLRLDDNWYIDNPSRVEYSIRTRGSVPDQWVVKEATCRLGIKQIITR
jgi:hypothetical protein